MLSEEAKVELAKQADANKDGIITEDEIPKWMKNPFSMFRDVRGAWSSKRIAAFICLTVAIVATVCVPAEGTLIMAWLTTGGALLGVSIGEKK